VHKGGVQVQGQGFTYTTCVLLDKVVCNWVGRSRILTKYSTLCSYVTLISEVFPHNNNLHFTVASCSGQLGG